MAIRTMLPAPKQPRHLFPANAEVALRLLRRHPTLRADLRRKDVERLQSFAANSALTFSASQPGSTFRVAPSARNSDSGSFRFNVLSASLAWVGPSHASARTASPAGWPALM